MRGRIPTPRNLKLLQGSFRKDRDNGGPEPAAELLPVPDFLSSRAKEEWNRLAPQLYELGLLTSLDRAALAMYCESYAEWVEASETLAREGSVRTTARGDIVKSVWITIEHRACERVLSLCREFGLTPSARSRVVPVPPPADGDGFSLA